MSEKKVRKGNFVQRLLKLVETYKNVLIVGVDNVGSNQMQKTRIALRGKAEILMGKNTIIRTQLRKLIADGNTKLQALHDLMRGNVGIVFTNSDLKEVRKVIQENKRPAAARQGVPASNDVFIPPGPTGLDPGQTSFFQALNIATKIVKGAIEIINQMHLIKKGDKVSASHVALLAKLNILPFFHGFQVRKVYEDGFVYDADVLDVSNDDLMKKFFAGVGKVAALSLAIGYPTIASLPHIINNTFKKLVSIAVATDITFEQVAKLKDLLSNPEALAAAQAAQAAAASAAPAAAGGGAAAKKEEPKKEEKPKEESGGDMGFSLFD